VSKSDTNKPSSGKVAPTDRKKALVSTPRAAGKKESTNDRRKSLSRRAADGTTIADPLPAKLLPPRLGQHYDRERLFGLLDRMCENHRVLWVNSPGGSGKTSLAVSYLQARKLPVLWYQADQGDGDIASFFYYMRLAAQQAAPRYKTPLPLFSPEYLGDVPTFTRNFFRELFRRLPKNSVLVLDNYQDVPESSHLHDVLHTAMNEIPEGIRLFVLSRAEPPAMLARLRLCDHAACLGWDTIQITRDETAGIARLRIGHDLPDAKSIDTLYARTGGWVAGLVLILEQSHNWDGFDTASLHTDKKLLFDYFASEVLNQHDPQIQEFLLKTSLLPNIRAGAALALTGMDVSHDILDDLVRRNYFTVRLTGSGEDTYQYHPLFRESLLSHLPQRLSGDEYSALRTLAAELLAGSGDVEDALELMHAAGETTRAAGLILTQAETMIRHGRFKPLYDWLIRLPEPLFAQEPWLLYWRATSQMPFDGAAAKADYAQAFAGFKARDELAGMLLSGAGLLQAYMAAWDELVGMDPWLDELAALMKRQPQFPAEEIEVLVTSSMIVALLLRRPQDKQLHEWVERGEKILGRINDSGIKLRLAMNLMWHYSYFARLQHHKDLLDTTRHLAESTAPSPMDRILWWLFDSVWGWSVCDTPHWQKAVEHGFGIAQESGSRMFEVGIVAQGVYGSLNDGDIEQAEHYLAEMKKLYDPHRRLDNSHYHYLAAWTAMQRRNYRTARVLGECAVEDSTIAGQPISEVWGRNLLAIAFHELGDPESAQHELAKAQHLAEDIGSPILQMQCACNEAYMLLHRNGAQKKSLDALRRALAIGHNNELFTYPGCLHTVMSKLCLTALQHDIEVDYVKHLIRLRHLLPDGLSAELEAWPWPVKIHALGRFGLLVDDKPLPDSASYRKPLELLQALIALGGRNVDEGRLAEMCWPDAEGDTAAQNLKVNVHRLRKLLPPRGKWDTLVWSDRKLSLDARRVWVDLWALERELSLLEQAATSGTAQQIVIAQRVLGMCRGELFPGNTAPWALAAREKLRNKTLRIVGSAADMITQQEPAAAIMIYEKMIEIDPLRETLYQGLMHCYRQLQQPAEALRIYQRCRDILSREMGLAPSPATEALRKSLNPGL